jgi:deoxyadenosine/deoxycytidine kinase
MSQKRAIKHVAVAGNIGAGKTSLSEKLSKHYGWDVLYEDTTTNPYLEDFYIDMKRWAFNLQIYFLNNRYQQVLSILAGDRTVIQDRTIYEDAFIFAPNLYEMGLMTKRDFKNYRELFDTMSSQISAPDLLIYLRANISTLVDHIQKRGREFEGNMSIDYLKKLNQKYESWIQDHYKGDLLIIEIDDLDFIGDSSDFGTILNKIDSEIHGLF